MNFLERIKRRGVCFLFETIDLVVIIYFEKITVVKFPLARAFECAFSHKDDSADAECVVPFPSPAELVADVEKHTRAVGIDHVCHTISEEFAHACVHFGWFICIWCAQVIAGSAGDEFSPHAFLSLASFCVFYHISYRG